jgi:hypothetical protein
MQIVGVFAPTGPAPTGLVIGGTPLTANLRWNPNVNAASYVVWRVDGPNARPVQVSPAGWTYSMLDNVMPDPRITYEYQVVVNYKDGTWGMASASFKSPAPVNPTGFQATVTAPDTVTLRWNPAPGAVQYRLDGAALPPTGMYLQQTTAEISRVPPGAQGWQLTALYPGNFADYQNRSAASVVNRSLPDHRPSWLTKNHGAGSAADAAAHYLNFKACLNCSSPGMGLNMLLDDLRIRMPRPAPGAAAYGGTAPPAPAPAMYSNVTELGKSRTTVCPIFGPRTVCWSVTEGRTVSMIVKDLDVMTFLQFESDGRPDYFSYGENMYLTDRATFDSEGPKFVPHVCLSCHGGRYDPNTKKVVGATFLPLDPSLLQVAPGQEENVRKVNMAILMSAPPPPPAIANYINELYNGTPFASGMAARTRFVPAAWAQEASIYTSIVKPHCVMCHLAARTEINFTSAGNFLRNKAGIHATVCSGRSMPHAEVPFRAFWTTDTGPIFLPGFLALRLGYQSCP